MESIGGLKNKSTSSTIQSNAQSSGKLKIKSKIIDGVVAAVSIQANDNTTINQNIILPESTGSKNETLRIKNDVTNNNEELEWYRVPEDSYSDLSNDRDVEFDIDVSNLNLNTGLSFDTDGGDFSNLINNKIGEDNNTAQYVRFNVSSNPPIYPQSFTYTPDPTNDHSLRKVQMWIRKFGTGTETDKTMFPSKFEIHGIPRGGSSSDSVLITTINSPEVNNMNYSASTEYGLNNPVIDESFNPDGLIYDSYEFKIYGNRVDENEDNYYKPVIGEIKLFGRKVIRNFTNNSIYQLQGISKFETLNVKVVSSSESVNKGGVYKTNLNTLMSPTPNNYYTINDITTPNLKFRTGQIYIFNQDDSSNDGHPITFYTDRAKSTEYTNIDNIKYIINDTEYDTSTLYNDNFGSNRYRRVKILITDDMPGRLYYQCINHSNMGGVIETGTATSSGGGGSALTVQDEGSALATAATTLNFVGENVTATGSGATKTITINNELTNWSEDSNGHILPNTNADYDIGSAEKKVRHLFLSDNSLYMGSGADTNAGTAISLDGDGDLKVGDTKLIKGDSSGNLPSSKLPSGIQTVTPQHTDNVLSGLTIGGTQYTVPSGGSGGGTTVTAHTDTQTGNEEFLSALTVDGTKYKVGTSVQQVSYSDTSKLLLSYPFSAAANATDAQTNYGSLTPDTTVFDYTEFVSGEGFQLRSSVNANDDNINITKSSGSFVDNEFTIYIRFKVRDDLTGDSNARIFESRNANDDSSSRIVINFESNASGAGTPNANFGFWTGSDNYFNELNPFGAGSISVGVWYHTFISLNFNTLRGHVFMNPNGDSTLNSYEMSGLTVTPEIANIQLNTTNADNNYHHNIDLANFSLFNYALSIDGAQQWMDYVDRGYVNEGNPAPLKFLADVSETPPNTNDVLFYNGTEWTGGFTELLQSVSRIGAGYGPPEGFINEDPADNHNRGSAPPLGQSAIYIPTEFQGNCTINGFTAVLFDNISNNMALNQVSTAPSTSVPYVLEIAIDVPKVVTNYAIYGTHRSDLPYPTAWDFQVYNPVSLQWVTLDTKTNQNMVSSSTRPSDQTQYQEAQLCGGTSGSNAIVNVIASTVYGDGNGNHGPAKLFDNAIGEYYNGWHSLSAGTTAASHYMWSDTAGDYVTINAPENDAYLQIRFTQPRMITKVSMLWRDNIPQQFPKSFSIYGSNTQPSVLRSTTGMNLLFSTDGTGYSQPPSTSWSGSAQNNLNSAYSFLIPPENQGHYEYLTFHFTEAHSSSHDIVITEMFLFHNEDKYATASVNTSILSRLYRFSITGSSNLSTPTHMQFGEIGMTFKQPTSVTEIGSVNTSSTPSNGDSLVYSSLSNQWMPQRAASQFGLPAGDNAKLWVVAGESVSRVGNYPIEHVGTGRTFSYDGDGHLYLSNPTVQGNTYLQVDSSNATVPPNGAFTVALVIDFDSSTSGGRSSLWAQASSLDSNTQWASPHLIYNHEGTNADTLDLDYYRDTNGSPPFFRFDGNGNLHGKMILVLTRQPSNGTTDWNATVSLYKNGTQFGSVTATDTLDLSSHSLDVDRVILTGEPTQDGFHANNKFYATAVWDRVLTTDEISQLTIDKLVTKRQTMPISDLSDITNVSTTPPTDGQALVYDSASSQWQPRSIVTSASADAIQLLNQARYWVVVGDHDNQDRNNNYFLNQVGTGWTTGVDNDGYTWAKGTYNNCKEITDSNAFIAKTDTTLTYAFVADFVIPSTNTNWDVSGEVVVMQEPQDNERTNHAVLFIHGDGGTNYGQTRGHLVYDNFLPSNYNNNSDPSNDSLMSQMSSHLGQKNLYVITVEPGSTYELKTSFYVNGTFVQSKESNDIYDTTTDTIQSIKIGSTRNLNHPGGESKFYGIAAWPRKLSSNEVSQLSIPLLLDPKTDLVTTFPVSSTAPTDGQALVYDSSLQVWQPGSVVSMVDSPPSSSDPDGTLKYDKTNGKLYLRTSNGWVAFSKDY